MEGFVVATLVCIVVVFALFNIDPAWKKDAEPNKGPSWGS